MVRESVLLKADDRSSPHPRGDGPRGKARLGNPVLFSPPTWGWSAPEGRGEPHRGVLPTHVGMVRKSGACAPGPIGSPHPRGDGPLNMGDCDLSKPFSPPTWGWSVMGQGLTGSSSVLPTHVGMVRESRIVSLPVGGSPHPRGDGPVNSCCRSCCNRFSPPTWGWSAFKLSASGGLDVLPTHVGMVRDPGATASCRPSSPHPRGDGPRTLGTGSSPAQFSPPTWGWSDHLNTFR